MLAENILLKTAYHFLLLLVGFDTLTYRKDYDRSPILVGHQVSYDAISTIVAQKLEILQGSNSRVIWLKFEGYKVQTDIRNEIQLTS